jgi:hypothetical protein
MGDYVIPELIGRLFGYDYVSVAAVKLDVIRSLLCEYLVDVRIADSKSAWTENSAFPVFSVVRNVINNLFHCISWLVCVTEKQKRCRYRGF